MSIQTEFKNPSALYRPRLRFWWPGGYVAENLEQLDAEMKSIAEAGFGGIEIADVYDGLPEDACQVLTPDKYGFTSDNWKTAIHQALVSAKKYGIAVDLTIGPHWPATTNQATPNDLGTAKELVYGTYAFSGQLLAGQVIEELCPPHYTNANCMADGSPIKNHLVGLYVATHTNHSEVDMPPAVPWEESYTVIRDDIAFESLQDMTHLVRDGQLVENMESAANMLLIAIYQRGTGQRVNMYNMCSPSRPDVMAPYAYVVDHFSKRGAELIIQLWEEQVLTDEMRHLIREVGHSFFEDSLELQSVGHWTDDMLEQFEQRMGYSLKPYLPFVLGINQDKGVAVEKASIQVEEIFMPKVAQWRQDYFRVLNELYLENHLAVLREWAHTYDMELRAQPYGWAIDSAATAFSLDSIEGESLGFGEDGNDAFRMLAAGRDFAGISVLSDEAGAYFGQGYATTLQQLYMTLHKNLMAGVNQTFWHGFAHQNAPEAKWPGFNAFNPMLGGRGFAEPWGPRQPVWQHLSAYTTYLGRLQYLLRQGKNNLDVLVYEVGHNASEQKKISVGDDLTRLGYRYQIMTEGLVKADVRIENGRLVTKGATYHSLYIPKAIRIPADVKAVLDTWTAAGLPTYHELSDLTAGLGQSALTTPDGSLLSVKRVLGETNLLVLFNQGKKELAISRVLIGQSAQELDLWTGTVKEVNTLSLAPGQVRVFECGKGQVLNQTEPVIWKTLDLNSINLSLDAWSMENPNQLRMLHSTKSIDLTDLQAWSEIEECSGISGIGTYKMTFSNQEFTELSIPGVSCSLKVTLNGQVLEGDGLLGRYAIAPELLQEENVLLIEAASTLNNYINVSPLGEYYGVYPQQEYGIKTILVR